MKKSLFIILMVCLALVGLVSCKNEIEPVQEELVSISFEEGASRALSATLESFDKGNYYWKYAAKKADTSNLISGQTANYDVVDPTEPANREAGAKWVKEGSTGLSDDNGAYKVQGFSQGLWNFTLYAYKRTGEGTELSPYVYTLVYQGETTGVLITAGTNGSHSVNVVVSPVQSGNGTLSVLITGDNKITLNPATPLPPEILANAKIQLGIDKLGTTPTVIRELSFIDKDYSKNDLEPGTYKVSVQFTNDDATVVYASGSVVATVYSGLTTTVSGNLSEVVTYIKFDAEQNPDIITTTIGTTNITQATTTKVTFGTSTDKVQASMPVATAKNLISNLEQELGAKTSDADHLTSSLVLNLSVDTTEATETTVTYEIGMEATLTYEKIGAASQDTTTTTSTVKNLNDYVTVVVDVASNVSGASVTHSGVPMHETSNITSVPSTQNPDTTEIVDGETIYVGFYQYDSANKKLYIKTRSFSPFEVTYSINEYVAAIGSTTYTSLQAALDAVDENGDVVTLLKDVSYNYTMGYTKNLTSTLDLNGHTLKVTGGKKGYDGGRAIRILAGTLTIKNGTIDGRNYNEDGEPQGNPSTSSPWSDTRVGGCVRLNGGNAVIQDVTMYNNDGWGNAVKLESNNTLTITGCTINSEYGACIEVGVGTAYISGCTLNQGLTASASYISNCVAVCGLGTAYLDAVTCAVGTKATGVTPLYVYNTGGAIVVKGGVYTASGNEVIHIDACTAANLQKEYDNIYSTVEEAQAAINAFKALNGGKSSVVRISGGDFTGNYNVASDEDAALIITGGTFVQEPTAYLASGYSTEYNNTISRWIIIPPEAVVVHESVETGYKTFAEALNAAQNGETLVINKDISLTSSNSLSKSITLDLNGNTITSTATLFNIYNSSVNLTIKDSGKNGAIDVSANKGIYVSSGSLRLEGGALSVHSSSSYTYGVQVGSGASFEMTGGSITIPSTSTSTYNYCVNNSGTVVISEGTLAARASGGNYAINSSSGTVTITGGSVDAYAYPAGFKSPYVLYITGGSCNVSGGYFRAFGDSATSSVGHLVDEDKSGVSISGGFFGGSYFYSLPSTMIAEGYECVLNTDSETKSKYYKYVVRPVAE